MEKNKILISGKAGTGKNTIATMLANKFGHNNQKTKIVALSDPMKNIIRLMFPEALSENLWGESKLRSEIISNKFIDSKEQKLTYRQALIDLGAFGRRYNQNIWLNCLVEDANNSKDIDTYIVSDVRYGNEFYYLKGAGFTTIRIVRENQIQINDSSELEQDKILNEEFDFIVYNNGSIEDLEKIIEDLSNKYLASKVSS